MSGYYRFVPVFSGLLFLVAIFLEIACFIAVGKAIGVVPTLALIFITIPIGSALLRRQGISLLQNIQNQFAQGQQPDQKIAQGFVTLVAAILLIIPGFITDIIGLCLLIPPIRQLFWHALSKYFIIRGQWHTNFGQSDSARHQTDDEKTIDLNRSDYHANRPQKPTRPNNDDGNGDNRFIQ